MNNYYAVIMAGGGGTRLWPLSRKNNPKQSLVLLGERTMFQIAVERLAPLFAPERILVVASAALLPELRAQAAILPADNFIEEPHPRGTAPAIALAALHVRRRDTQAIMACLPADHCIGDEAHFRALLRAAAQVAQRNYLVTLGISPTYPATGFGYIKRGEPLGTFDGSPVFKAVQFKEKPDRATAEAMLADGLHSWNAGMFVWRVERLLTEFARQMPALHELLLEIDAEPATLERLWPQMPCTTIDYGVMEGASDVAVIPATNLGWSDIGCWDAVRQALGPGADGNVIIGEGVSVETTGTIVYSRNESHRLVAVLGVKDMVIVDTDDILLVCPRSRSQDVRLMVERLKELGKEHYL